MGIENAKKSKVNGYKQAFINVSIKNNEVFGCTRSIGMLALVNGKEGN